MRCSWAPNLSGDHFVSYVTIELLCRTPETPITLTVNRNFYKRGLLAKVATSRLPELWLSGGCATLSTRTARRAHRAHDDAVCAETCFPPPRLELQHIPGRGWPSDRPSGPPSPARYKHVPHMPQLAAGEIAPIPCDCTGRRLLTCASGFPEPPSCTSALCGPGSAPSAARRLSHEHDRTWSPMNRSRTVSSGVVLAGHCRKRDRRYRHSGPLRDTSSGQPESSPV